MLSRDAPQVSASVERVAETASAVGAVGATVSRCFESRDCGRAAPASAAASRVAAATAATRREWRTALHMTSSIDQGPDRRAARFGGTVRWLGALGEPPGSPKPPPLVRFADGLAC